MNPQVNLYIETEAHGPKRTDGAYGWVLEFIRSDGRADPRTLNGVGVREDTIDRDLALEAIAEALGRLNKTCDVDILVGPQYMAETFPTPFVEGWVERWEANDWKNSKGREIHAADLWKNCVAALRKHDAVFAKKHAANPYKNWILSEINRAVRKQINENEELENHEAAENGNFVKFNP